tara:strand:- start:561 stop:785 length:225 start_codon:yes stop_codon:yes gene_type:complete
MPEVNYDYAKLPKERISECLKEYINDDSYEAKDAYEEILNEAKSLVEYHDGQSQKAMGLYEHLLGYGPIDYPYK